MTEQNPTTENDGFFTTRISDDFIAFTQWFPGLISHHAIPPIHVSKNVKSSKVD